MNFEFHPEALEEFHEAAVWYEDRSIFAGERFVKAVRHAIDQIMRDPAMYQSLSDGTQVFRLKTFPFRMYYVFETEEEMVRIHAVMHEKRRPDYWHHRLRH